MKTASITLFVFILLLLAISLMGQDTRKSPHGDVRSDGSVGYECQDCHSTASWNEVRQPMVFKHADTGFPLLGSHKKTRCISCHKEMKFAHIGTSCADCHPDIHRGQFGISCQDCHTPDDWRNRHDIFSLHAAQGFPLIGVHAIADCRACHINEQRNEFAGTPIDCQGCHKDDFAASNNPDHIRANFSKDCQACHSPIARSWSDVTYMHTTAFPLHGAHSRVACNICHVSAYAGIAPECPECHAADYQATTNPAHAVLGFPLTCEVCHNDNSWNESSFDHLQASQFELRGMHVTIRCNECHINNQFQGLPLECFGCHQNDYNNAANPNHAQVNFPQTCQMCHNENGWSPATFDHNQTGFPLLGAHLTVSCNLCHQNGIYPGTPRECYACHQNDYNSVSDPNHLSNNFNHDCIQCHTVNAWRPSTFNHSQTIFPLTGAHLGLQCIACHASGYQNIPADCYSCHRGDYERVSDPNHVQNNFSQDCALCHNTSTWGDARFDHSGTRFLLTGAHTLLQCLACHANGYQNTPYDCFACHENDYDGVADPSHVQNNFNHDCTQCHTTTAWSPAIFDHSQTRFPLTGAHTLLQCLSCHANGYQNTPYECFACHENDYNGVSDPNHVQNNFNHDCTQCHTTTAWSPATFDHSQTQFPLTGAHVSLPCISCHANGYQNTPTDCYSCHLNDYNNAIDPNHRAQGFPTSCQDCHNTTRWDQSSFDHDGQYFPIYSGRHQQQWNTCADCHVNSNDFRVFECIFCHEHNRQDTDDRHTGVPGYEYNSNACYACHPRVI